MSGEGQSTEKSAAGGRASQTGFVALSQWVCASVIAVIAGWGVLQAGGISQWFEIPEELQHVGIPTNEQAAQITAANRIAEYQNTSLVAGVLGALIGGLLATVGAVERKSMTKVGLALVSGVACGGILGATGAPLGIALGEKLAGEWPLRGLLPATAIHSTLWLFAGLGVGLAVGVSTGSRTLIAQTAVAGLGAGLVAGFFYVPLASFLFPLAKELPVVPGGAWSRLLWVALPAGLMSLAVGRIAVHRASSPSHNVDRQAEVGSGPEAASLTDG